MRNDGEISEQLLGAASAVTSGADTMGSFIGQRTKVALQAGRDAGATGAAPHKAQSQMVPRSREGQMNIEIKQEVDPGATRPWFVVCVDGTRYGKRFKTMEYARVFILGVREGAEHNGVSGIVYCRRGE